MKPIVFLIIISLLASMFMFWRLDPSLAGAIRPTKVVQQIPSTKKTVWEAVNDWRAENGYKRYIESDFLCGIADVRLKEVSVNFSHDGFTMGRFGQKSPISENLNKSDGSATNALMGWLSSPPHRKALEADYTHACIRCNYTYCVQIFGYY